VSPVVGLYAAPGALLLYAALGSSPVLVMGPMAAAAALSAATVADLGPVGDGRLVALTAGLAITAGVAALISDDRDLTAPYPTIKAAIAALT
jgi:sulfate permease, SulP family